MPIFRPFRHHGTALPSSAADRLTMCTFLVNWSSRSFWCAVGLFLPIHCLILVSHLFFPYSLVSRIFATVTQRNAANQVSGLPCYFRPPHNYRVAEGEPTILTGGSFQAVIRMCRRVFEPRPFARFFLLNCMLWGIASTIWMQD